MTADPDWLATGLDHLWLPYAQMKTAPAPLPVRAAEGSKIVLADRRTLVDGVASWWTAVHGYNHPRLVEAGMRQLETLPHVMLGGLAHEQVCRLAARLAAIAPGDLNHVFFSESGSVAVEVAMKMAAQYWRNTTGRVRTKFVAFRGGYHGDTFATMSVCDPEEGMHALFAGALARQHIAELPMDDDAGARLAATIAEDPEIAGVIVEPLIQGAGGMLMHAPETLARLRAACDATGALLIFDEIFTGFGRTGAMFAADRAGVAPDIMTLGKALTGGAAPLAATLASRRVFDAFYDDDPEKALMHGPTYTGHALGCALANASLDLFTEEPRIEQVSRIEARLAAALLPLATRPGVAAARVMGAVGAVEMARPFDLDACRRRFIERGVFVRPIGRTIYLTPAYTISENELDLLVGAVAEEAEALAAAG